MYYLLTSVYNLWFIAGIWVFIWGKFMTKTEMGLSDAITFGVGFLFELPSGVFADFIGRKKAIFIANVLLVIGNFGVAFGSSFFGITAWYLIWTIGYAFQSGSTEALAYDSLKLEGEEEKWNEVIGTANIIQRVSSMVANVIGGLLFGIWFRLPYLIFAFSGFIGIYAAYKLVEIPVKLNGSLWSFSSYISQIKDGFRVLGKVNVTPVAIISLLVAGMSYLYNWGLLRPLTAERFGYSGVTFPLLLFVSSISIIFATYMLFLNVGKFRLEKGIYVFSILYIILFALQGGSFKWMLGGLIMVLVSTSSSLVDQLFSKFINIHTRSEHRATTLSATALIVKFPYVLLAVVMGILAENNLLAQFCIIAGIVAFFVWVLSFLRYRKIDFQEVISN